MTPKVVVGGTGAGNYVAACWGDDISHQLLFTNIGS